MHEYKVMNLKHSTHVTKHALPSLMRLITLDILNYVLVNGEAKEASSFDRASPTSAYLKAQVSLVPSPQKAMKFDLSYLSNSIKSPLLLGFILA